MKAQEHSIRARLEIRLRSSVCETSSHRRVNASPAKAGGSGRRTGQLAPRGPSGRRPPPQILIMLAWCDCTPPAVAFDPEAGRRDDDHPFESQPISENMAMPIEFVQVDAFTHHPLYGNHAAVVFDADAIPTETMQRIAREMNLSETAFVSSRRTANCPLPVIQRWLPRAPS